MRHVFLAVVFGASFAGCDDSPTKKCEQLIDTYCDTVTSCAEDADLLDPSYSASELMADCKRTVGDTAHCDDAQDVTSNFDRCLSAASDLDCDDSNASLLDEQTFEIPAICEGVVEY